MQIWDKVFEKNSKIKCEKVSFKNRFGIEIVGDLYTPKSDIFGSIAVCGPFGAVKEQSSGLYAQTLATYGYIALAFDPSFTGESGPKNVRDLASADINSDDFSAAVDFLSKYGKNIGILGICGWGGLALNAACVDSRVKAVVTSTMYDMARFCANGYFDSMDEKKRDEQREIFSKQRLDDFNSGVCKKLGGVAEILPDDAPQFAKDYHDYYKTKRGYHKRSVNSNDGWNATGLITYFNSSITDYIDELKSAVLMIHGDKAHSYYFSKDTYVKLKGENKHFLTIKNANHTDLYDNLDFIPFGEIDKFYKKYL